MGEKALGIIYIYSNQNQNTYTNKNKNANININAYQDKELYNNGANRMNNIQNMV